MGAFAEWRIRTWAWAIWAQTWPPNCQPGILGHDPAGSQQNLAKFFFSYLIISQYSLIRKLLCSSVYSFFFFFLKFYLFFERDRDSVSRLGAEREGERESPTGALLVSTEPDGRAQTYETMRSWPELKSRVRRLTDWATEVPLVCLLFKYHALC